MKVVVEIRSQGSGGEWEKEWLQTLKMHRILVRNCRLLVGMTYLSVAYRGVVYHFIIKAFHIIPYCIIA